MQRDVVDLDGRIFLLEQRNLDIQKRYEAVQRENIQMKSMFEAFDSGKDEKEKSLRSQSAGLYAMVDELREEIRSLRGRTEETDHLLKRTMTAFQESEKKKEYRLNSLENRLTKLEQYIDVNAPVYDSRTRSAPARTEKEISERELYKLAKQAFDQGDYERARKGFQLLLRKYTHSEHADNAYFWIGETYYRERDYKKAILTYQEVIEKYPVGNKVRASLLKQGFSFFNLGNRDHAREILQELIDKYPDSEEARTAREKISGF
ncbi:MAG: tol-pal system protein YbgF [Desulfobacteraceae bacterium]|nr:tol-pal system protein YbgF [Desulfobacteraceae bacterium]